MRLNNGLVYDEDYTDTDDYEEVLRYYNDTLFDYADYDAETFAYYLFKYPDIIDASKALNKFIPNEHNYLKMRNGLLHVADIPDCIEWIVDKFGLQKVINDKELMEHIHNTYTVELVNAILDQSKYNKNP